MWSTKEHRGRPVVGLFSPYPTQSPLKKTGSDWGIGGVLGDDWPTGSCSEQRRRGRSLRAETWGRQRYEAGQRRTHAPLRCSRVRRTKPGCDVRADAGLAGLAGPTGGALVSTARYAVVDGSTGVSLETIEHPPVFTSLLLQIQDRWPAVSRHCPRPRACDGPAFSPPSPALLSSVHPVQDLGRT